MITKSNIAVKVPFSDIDMMGFCHHPAIVEYLERARIDLLRVNGVEVDVIHSLGWLLATSSIDLTLSRPLFFRDCLTIDTKIDRMNTLCIVTSHDIGVIRENAIVSAVTGKITTVFLDRKTFLPKQIPEEAWDVDTWDETTLAELMEAAGIT